MKLLDRYFVGKTDVFLGENILHYLVSDQINILKPGRSGVLFFDSALKKEFVEKIEDLLTSSGVEVKAINCHALEKNKNNKALESCYRALEEENIGRDGFLISLGGGIVTDIGGFASSTWVRGIDHIAIPTTLLGIVDATIGGKCGVNRVHECGRISKNMIGSFYEPVFVIADLQFLNTLKDREWRSGLGEVIKHGVIADREILFLLEDRGFENGVFGDIYPIINKAIWVKKKIVDDDLREQGNRIFLNLGHTFAHAIESCFPDKISHGEAVGLGILSALAIASSIGEAVESLQDQVKRILQKYGLPVFLPIKANKTELRSAMKFDKKQRDGRIRIVLPLETGVKIIHADEKMLSIGWDEILLKI